MSDEGRARAIKAFLVALAILAFVAGAYMAVREARQPSPADTTPPVTVAPADSVTPAGD